MSVPQDIVDARSTLASARVATAAQLNQVAAREADLEQALRENKTTSTAVATAQAAAKQARDDLLRARSDEANARDALQEVLNEWLQRLTPADDLAETTELNAAFPIVLLPVKIQTRFLPIGAPTELLVRIYPDQILADTHEPALTAGERTAGVAYWTDGWDPKDEPEAWRALLRRLPATRAAWVVLQTTPTNLATRPAGSPTFPATTERPGAWTRAAEARLLPDRWLVVGYRGGKEVRRALGQPIRDPLALSPDPVESDPATLVDLSGDGLALDPEMLWLVDFSDAERAGMALRMPIDASDVTDGFDQLIVVGVKASLAPDEASDRLGELLRGHHYGRGLAFVPQGTPTNNTPERPSGWPPQDDGGRASYALERDGLTVGPDSDGTKFATALGLGQQLAQDLPHLQSADGGGDHAAATMNEALWPATWGYYLEQLLAPGFDQKTVEAVHSFFNAYVRGRGPYPAFRVGETPYGLLPVSTLASWVAPTGAGAVEANLPRALTAIEDVWRRQIESVARIRGGTDPDAELLDVLAMDASAREVRLRDVWGADLVANLFRLYGFAFFGLSQSDWQAWTSRRQEIDEIVRRQLSAMGWPAATPGPRIARAAVKPNAYRYRFDLVTSDALSDTDPLRSTLLPLTPPVNYIEWLVQAPWTELRKPLGGETPPLLFLLLRQALLAQYAHNVFDILIAQGLATEADRREPELVGVTVSAAGAKRPPIWDRFAQPVPAVSGPLPLGDFVARGGNPQTRTSDAYKKTLRLLMQLPTAELERLLTETLDVCSHRIDAWITALVTQRLEMMRQANASGCHLGAFGFIEDLRPLPRNAVQSKSLNGRTVWVQTGSGGHVHAPSMAHAATAAVLRSGYLNRAGEAQKPFALNLSSGRVCDALSLLDAVRQGQPLGAILGYRFERRLHERSNDDPTLNLEQFIQPLRDHFPLVANKGNPSAGATSTTETARNLVDGLALWRKRDQSPFSSLTPAPSATQTTAMTEELSRIDTALDAAADLLVAESVHQLVAGNTAGSGASLEAMAEGKRPPEPDVAIARRGGATLTHRVAVVLGAAKPTTAGTGWPQTPTPRAAAEPYLDAWIGSVIGDPAKVQCRVAYPAPTQPDPKKRVTGELVTLKDLTVDTNEVPLLRPIDLVSLAATTGPAAGATELDRRVADHVLDKHKLTIAPGEIEITYAPDPAWNRATTRSFPDVLETARALERVIGGARPLAPRDVLPPDRSADAGEIDSADLQTRAAGATKTLTSAIAALSAAVTATANIDNLLSALRGAAALGVPGAFPASREPDELVTQARSAQRELQKRKDAADGAPDAGGVLEAVFGRGFTWLPRFTPSATTTAELALALGAASTLLGKDSDAPWTWFQQAARIRAPLARWRKFSLYTRAFGIDTTSFSVAQLPFVDGARWAALPFDENPPPPQPPPLSLVLHRVQTPAATDPWVGLLLDEWSEVIPRAAEQTGVAFHYDDAGSEAPNAILVAVPPDPTATTWDTRTLLAILRDTLELSKLRAVEGEMLGELGQLLPAILVASNAAGDTVETRFNSYPGAGPLRVGDLTV